MISETTKTLVAGAALIVLSAGSAWAYLPEGKTFHERAGSAASLTLADVASDPTAQALKTMLAIGDKNESFADKRDRAGMVEFYAERDYEPVWVVDGKLTPAARQVIDRIAAATEDGLDPSAFHLPPSTLREKSALGPDLGAAVEAALSRAVLAYGRIASTGQVDPSKIGKLITLKPLLPDPIAILTTASTAADPKAAIDGFNPQQPGYQRLKKALATARASSPAPRLPAIAEGKLIKAGGSDPRVPAIRAHLGLPAATVDENVYDPALVAAVEAFQAGKGLKADGAIGGNTIAFLNGLNKDQTAEILANMERWRWEPRDMGDFHIEVNVPEFTVRVFDDNKVVHSARVVTGKVTNQTPIFSDEMESIVVNPSWNIPASITLKEMAPKARRDPSYLSRNGYQVLANVGGKFRAVDPTMIDWSNVNAAKVQIRQPPGDDNALGSIKFLFPNEHSVYLHDTPSKSLFKQDVRAFSHGCVRVQDPLVFADVLLAYEGGWTPQRLRKMIGGRESWVNLPKHIPIHITYFTASVDDDGTVVTRPDIYGYNARVEKALGL